MIELGPENGIVDPEEILKLSKDKLKEVLGRVIDEDTEPEKIDQYRKARRNDFYWRGIFELAPTRVSDEIVDFTAVGVPISNQNKRRRETPYNFNIIRGDFMKAIAVLGSKAPDVSATPDEADDEDSLDVARRADVVGQKLRNGWDVNRIQQELMLDLALTTTSFVYTPWVVNGERYGWTEEPEYENEEVPFGDPHYKCVGCGNETPVDQAMETGVCSGCLRPHTEEDHQQPTTNIPKLKGTNKYPNGAVECHVTNVFTTSTAFFIASLKEAEWLRYEIETTPSSIIEIFPDIDKSTLENVAPATSGYGTEAREMASSENGIRRNRANTVRFARYWLRPSFLNNLREEKVTPDGPDGKGKEQNLMELLKNRFGRGLRITLVNGEIMDLFEESIDDCWTACKPTVSKYMYCDPLCHDSIPYQELENRMSGIAVQTLLRSLPVTFVPSDLLDRQTIANRTAEEVEIVPYKAKSGRPINESFGQLPPSRFSDQMTPWQASKENQRREVNGVTQQLFGAGPALTTAHEAEIRKQQALMQLRVTYNNTRTANAEFTEKGVRMYSRYAPGQMKGLPGNGVLGPVAGQLVDVADLVDGKFHFEADEAMPRTFEDEREAYKQMVSGPNAATPALQHAAGLDSAVNGDRIQKFFGLAGAYYPGKDERKKLRTILSDLLQAAPNQDGSPSVPLDAWDDAALMAALMGAWLNSDAGQSERQSNSNGFQNAVAYWTAANQAANPPQQPQHKTNVNVNVKPDPGQATALLNDVGLEVPQAAPVPPPPPPAAGGRKKPHLPPAPLGGMGMQVPEPAGGIPQPAAAIPNA